MSTCKNCGKVVVPYNEALYLGLSGVAKTGRVCVFANCRAVYCSNCDQALPKVKGSSGMELKKCKFCGQNGGTEYLGQSEGELLDAEEIYRRNA